MNKRKLRNLEVNPIGVGCMSFSHGYGEIPSEEYSIQAIQKAQAVHPLSAIQNIYSMVERSCEEEVIPYCTGTVFSNCQWTSVRKSKHKH